MKPAARYGRSFRPLDWLYLFYTFATGLLLVGAGAGSLGRAMLIVVHGSLLLVPFFLSRLRSRDDFWSRFLSSVYPLLFVILFYREINILNQVLSSGYHDEEIRALEGMLLIGDLRERLLCWFPYFWLEALLNVGYLSYYFLLPAVGVPLALKSRWDDLEEFVFVNFLTYSTSYILFIVYPVIGPFLEIHPPGSFGDKDWISWLSYTVVNWGGAHGAAFPSAHVAVAVLAVVLARRYKLRVFWVLVPCALGLVSGTVYGGYHYPVDAVAGILLGVAALIVAPYFHSALQRLSGCPTTPPPMSST